MYINNLSLYTKNIVITNPNKEYLRKSNFPKDQLNHRDLLRGHYQRCHHQI